MYDRTITLFNFHAKSGRWFSTVISKVDILATESRSSTTTGMNNADSVSIIIRCTPSKLICGKDYLQPKQFAKCDTPDKFITFLPESDFIYDGIWNGDGEVIDDDYNDGFYHAMNDEYDNIYMITSVEFFSLLPHFEIGGK